MPATESTMLELGTQAPDFQLSDVVTGNPISLETFAGKKAFLAIFASPHCPFVKHVQSELAHIGQDYSPKNVGIVLISANDIVSHPNDGPDGLKTFAVEQGFNFPVLFDETQATAKAYKAACTPDFFLFDNNLNLVYRGQLDDSRPKNEKPVTGKDLRAAIDAVLAGQPVSSEQRPSIGCNIKWKAGNEPSYFAVPA